MKKAVFFDIDGTLWNSKCEILPTTIEAIRRLRENGDLAFICSGRSRSCIRNESLLGIGFDGVIASCGAHVDFHNEVVFEELLPAELVAHILETTKKHHIPVVLEGPQYIYVDQKDFKDDPFVLYLRAELGDDVREIPKDVTEIQINKFSASAMGVDLASFIKDLGPKLDVIVHDADQVFEAVPAGYSKAVGIQKVCELCQVAIEDTYAFGDSENDHEMLSYVRHAIVMGNANSKTKELANFITTDVDDDGIMNGLKHFGLI